MLLCAGAAAQPRSPRSEAEATLAQVQAQKEHASVAAEPVGRARRALERAESIRQAGDRERAPLLERAARQWAELARDLLRAIEAERAADEAEARLTDVETRTVRARALLEETMARRGRAQAQVEQLEAPPAPSATPATPGKPAGKETRP
jgi:hypothetical protein